MCRCLIAWSSLILAVTLLGCASVIAEDQDTEIPVDKLVEFITKNETFNADIDQKLTLPCDIANFDEGTIRVWMKNEDVLFAGSFKVTPDDHVSVDEKGSLFIDGVREGDGATYTCRINSQIIPNSIHHKVYLPGPPELDYSPKSGERQVFLGLNFTIRCSARGNPTPTVTWKHLAHSGIPKRTVSTRSNDSSLDLSSLIKGDTIEILAAERKHAGTYECTASNGIGKPQVARILVKVIGKPTVKASIRWAEDADGLTADLVCITHSDVQATTRWVRGDGTWLLETGDVTLHTVGNQYTAKFRKVSERYYDNYTCESTNSFGITKDTVQLSAVPSRPEVSALEAPTRKTYSITLTTATPFSATEFIVYIRKAEDEHDHAMWRNTTIPINKETSMDSLVTVNHVITNLEPSTKYHAYAVAVNEHGKSHPSDFTFSTALPTEPMHSPGNTEVSAGLQPNDPDALQESSDGSYASPPARALSSQVMGCLTVVLLSFFFW
ncbi:limbic system-associated membrane protein-like isoform X2 [Ornithodoros turicata]|uniref:limbic system-associated membrane protein-like isoform X2 n=1 Tax=Ornithodoros turicata TaxID=34597 RepID=UPI003138B8F8